MRLRFTIINGDLALKSENIWFVRTLIGKYSMWGLLYTTPDIFGFCHPLPVDYNEVFTPPNPM